MTKVKFKNIKIRRYSKSKFSWRCSISVNKPYNILGKGFTLRRRLYENLYQTLIIWAFNNAKGKFRPFSFGNSMGVDFELKQDVFNLKEFLLNYEKTL
jgi:hypothetical protein